MKPHLHASALLELRSFARGFISMDLVLVLAVIVLGLGALTYEWHYARTHPAGAAEYHDHGDASDARGSGRHHRLHHETGTEADR